MIHLLFLSFLLCLMLHDVLLINGIKNIPCLSWAPWGTSNLAQLSKVIKDNQPKMQGVCGTPDSKLHPHEAGASHPAKTSYLHLTLWCPGFGCSNSSELTEDGNIGELKKLVDNTVLLGGRGKTKPTPQPWTTEPLFPLRLFADYF